MISSAGYVHSEVKFKIRNTKIKKNQLHVLPDLQIYKFLNTKETEVLRVVFTDMISQVSRKIILYIVPKNVLADSLYCSQLVNNYGNVNDVTSWFYTFFSLLLLSHYTVRWLSDLEMWTFFLMHLSVINMSS